MRLIDADALTEEVWHSGLGSRQDCVDLIKSMPTVKRPHGVWEQQYKNDGKWHDMGYFDHMYKCSRCGADGSQRWHFCPNCGASMSANDRQVTGKLNSEIEKSKSEIVPDYRDGWRLRGEAE